ncbi:MAG TPA: hypothetical protein PLW68_12920 [Casimicrobiaceae bacterium]|nr:hypothetical protein [Casimicrobiaceae bacterium]
MTLDEFLDAAWNDHADRPQEVAERMAGSFHLVSAPEHIAPFARLLTHVHGEHLGQWNRGIELLTALRELPAFDGSDRLGQLLDRNVAALSHCAGDGGALDSLPADERVASLAIAASALAGRAEHGKALAAYDEALRLADAGLPDGSPAIRALAVGGNNLAAALEEKSDRDASETEGMVAAAQGGLRYWKLAGTWLEEERAEYRLARSLLQAGQARTAIASATRCIDVCTRNSAPSFEQFFGHAVLALAQRAAGEDASFAASRANAIALFGQIPEDERQWAQSTLRELGA